MRCEERGKGVGRLHVGRRSCGGAYRRWGGREGVFGRHRLHKGSTHQCRPLARAALVWPAMSHSRGSGARWLEAGQIPMQQFAH